MMRISMEKGKSLANLITTEKREHKSIIHYTSQMNDEIMKSASEQYVSL
jgi:hypothetical protein